MTDRQEVMCVGYTGTLRTYSQPKTVCWRSAAASRYQTADRKFSSPKAVDTTRVRVHCEPSYDLTALGGKCKANRIVRVLDNVGDFPSVIAVAEQDGVGNGLHVGSR